MKNHLCELRIKSIRSPHITANRLNFFDASNRSFYMARGTNLEFFVHCSLKKRRTIE